MYAMPGSRLHSYRAGDLAEGLGLEMLRRFSAVAPVPRQEDIGIDAVCTLLRKEKRTLHAENTFAVQIKTTSVSVIEMNENACLWLRNLDMPFFLLSVDLQAANANLYSYEWAIIRYFESDNTPRARKLYTHKPANLRSNSEIQPYILVGEDDEVSSVEQRWLGPPIVSFSLSDLVQEETVNFLYRLLKSWCTEVSRSIFLRNHNIDSDLHWLTGHSPKRTSKFISVSSNEAVESLEAIVPLLWRAELAINAGTNRRVPEFEAMWKLLAAHGVSLYSDKFDLDDYKDFGIENFAEHVRRALGPDKE